MPYVPHHHHGDVECMAIERCASDNLINDEHTSHHADKNSAGSPTCVKNILSLKAKFGTSVCNVRLFPLLALFFFGTGLLLVRDATPLHYGYSSLYKSPQRRGYKLLRAPPRQFS